MELQQPQLLLLCLTNLTHFHDCSPHQNTSLPPFQRKYLGVKLFLVICRMIFHKTGSVRTHMQEWRLPFHKSLPPTWDPEVPGRSRSMKLLLMALHKWTNHRGLVKATDLMSPVLWNTKLRRQKTPQTYTDDWYWVNNEAATNKNQGAGWHLNSNV